MKVYKIVHARGWQAARGFYSLKRAQEWLEAFDPKIYTEEGLKKEDFRIIEETAK